MCNRKNSWVKWAEVNCAKSRREGEEEEYGSEQRKIVCLHRKLIASGDDDDDGDHDRHRIDFCITRRNSAERINDIITQYPFSFRFTRYCIVLHDIATIKCNTVLHRFGDAKIAIVLRLGERSLLCALRCRCWVQRQQRLLLLLYRTPRIKISVSVRWCRDFYLRLDWIEMIVIWIESRLIATV